MVLAMDGQRESLQQFKAKYFLSRFDGASDESLQPTWGTRADQVKAGGGKGQR